MKMKRNKKLISLIMAVLMIFTCFAIPSVAQAKECIHCSGKGTRWCQNCNGSGTIHKFKAYKNDFDYEKCPKCHGDGQETCVYCNGTGGTSDSVKPTIKNIYAVKKGFVVDWTYPVNCSGYQVQYSRNSKFKNAKKVKVKGQTNANKTVKKLKSKKKYYVRVRAYKVNKKGKTVYSKWSKANAVKTN